MLKSLTKSFLLLVLLFTTSFTFAQRNVSGVVTDAKTNEALIGANVLVKGTSIGTITDVDGAYSLSVPGADAVLVISYTGYSDQENHRGYSEHHQRCTLGRGLSR
jgi:hypothetical protein